MNMKNKLFIATLATAVTIPSVVVPMPMQAEAVTKKFTDVPKTSPYYEIIHEMADQGIISGYPDGKFRPGEVISRKHAAALISRATGKDLKRTQKPVRFKDVPSNSPYFDDIQKLQMAGIFEPDVKGNFNPQQPVTRAEMAKILTIAFDLKVQDEQVFRDVPTHHPAHKYVRAIYSNGITTGDNGLFKPEESLTRAHYAVFMHRAMNLGKKQGDVSSMTEEELHELSNDQLRNKLIMYNYYHGEDVPLPKGQTDRVAFSKKMEKEFNTYFVQNGLNRKSSTPLISRDRVDIKLKNRSKIIEKPLSEVIQMYNHVVTTGEMVTNTEDDPVKFAMYFNYEENRLYFGFLFIDKSY